MGKLKKVIHVLFILKYVYRYMYIISKVEFCPEVPGHGLIWNVCAGSWNYGTYHKDKQRRLRRACASAQSRQSLRCSHTWSMVIDEGSNQKPDIYPHWMAALACLKKEFTEDEKYHNLMTWLNYCIRFRDLRNYEFFLVHVESLTFMKYAWWSSVKRAYKMRINMSIFLYWS